MRLLYTFQERAAHFMGETAAFSVRNPKTVIGLSFLFIFTFLPGLSRVPDLTVTEAKLLWVDQGSRARLFDIWAEQHYQEFGRPQFVVVTKGSGVGDYENVLDETGLTALWDIYQITMDEIKSEKGYSTHDLCFRWRRRNPSRRRWYNLSAKIFLPLGFTGWCLGFRV